MKSWHILALFLVIAGCSEGESQAGDAGPVGAFDAGGCAPESPWPCCDDVMPSPRTGGAPYSWSPVPSVVDAEGVTWPELGDEALLDAVWEAVRASADSTHPTELVLRDSDGVDHTFRFARAIAEFPHLQAGTPVHVDLVGGVTIRRADGSLVLAAIEHPRESNELPFGLEQQSETGCHLPYYIFVSGPPTENLCYIGFFRYDLLREGEPLTVGEALPITLDEQEYELTLHAYQTQTGERTPGVDTCGPAYWPDLVLEIYPSHDELRVRR